MSTRAKLFTVDGNQEFFSTHSHYHVRLAVTGQTLAVIGAGQKGHGRGGNGTRRRSREREERGRGEGQSREPCQQAPSFTRVYSVHSSHQSLR